MTAATWRDVALALYRCPEGAVLRVPKPRVQHPTEGGLRLAIDVPRGQLATYQRTFENGSSLWVKDFGAHYDASVQRQQLVGMPHPATQAPNTLAAGAAAGTLIAALLGRTSAALLLGAALGGALAAVAMASPESRGGMSDRQGPSGTS